MECSTCRGRYEEASTIDGRTVRTICKCEAGIPCARCKKRGGQPANQALLFDDGEVESYRCAEHGVEEAREWGASKAPTPPPVAKPPKEKAREIVKETKKKLDWRMICRRCKKDQDPSLRMPKFACPHCGEEEVDLVV